MSRGRVVWVSTSTRTRGGVATYVTTVRGTPLWSRWSVRHVSTHQDGSRTARILAFIRGALHLVVLLAVRRPALVHLHTASYGSFARKSVLVWCTRARGVPVVLHVHGAAFAEFHASLPRVLQAYVRATLRTADVVVALGPTWAERLRAIAPGVRVEVVPNAVRPQPLAERDPGTGPVTVLFLGRVTEDKGVFALVEAWAATRAAVPDRELRLVVAGSGREDDLRDRARELGVAASVDVVGWQGADQVEVLLSGADLLVLPSWWEGQPMAVLEAMARGIPVVASAVGGVPDLLGDDAGLLVPPRDVPALTDALVDMVTDAERRRATGRRALERVEAMYDVGTTWRALDHIYEELTGG